LIPFQHRLILSQKCRPSGEKSGEFFKRRRRSMGCPHPGYTMEGNLFALLQAENQSITWKSYMWDFPCGVLKFAVNSSMDIKAGLSQNYDTALKDMTRIMKKDHF
jgi:hypothetical protein